MKTHPPLLEETIPKEIFAQQSFNLSSPSDKFLYIAQTELCQLR